MGADTIRDIEAKLRHCVNRGREPDYSKGLTIYEWTLTLGKKNTTPVSQMLDAAVNCGEYIQGKSWRKWGKGYRENDVYKPKNEKDWKASRAAFEPIRKRLEAQP